MWKVNALTLERRTAFWAGALSLREDFPNESAGEATSVRRVRMDMGICMVPSRVMSDGKMVPKHLNRPATHLELWQISLALKQLTQI